MRMYGVLYPGHRYVIRDEPPPCGKDCNDYLMHVCQQNKSRRMAAARFEHPR